MGKTNRLGSRFWRLWTATGISSLGDGMVLVAFPLLALTFTRNPVALAGVVVAGRLPVFLVALPAGAVADRVDRRRMLFTLELLRFTTLTAFAAVVLSGADSLAAVYLTVFVLGALTVCFDVTAAACLPTIVEGDRLVAANAHLMTAEVTTKEMVGQAVGGTTFALIRSLPFGLDALSFAASAVLLRFAVPANRPVASDTTLWHDLKAGLRWLTETPLVRILVGVVASLAFCQAMVLGVLVLFGREDLHLSMSGYGLLLSVGAIGNIAGALMSTRVHRRLGSGWTIVTAGLLAAISYPLLASTSSAVVASTALAIETIAVVLGNVAARSLRQSSVPAEFQGRVGSAYQMFIFGSLPLGGLAGGLLAAWMGVRTTIALAGLIQLAVLAVLAPRLIAQVRRRISVTPIQAVA